MGYNLFNIKEISGIYYQKLCDFRSSLGAAIGRGDNIPILDSDNSYLLKLQHDRIMRKGLEMDYDVYLRDENSKKFIAGSNWTDAHYVSTVCFSPCGVKRVLKKGEKVCYKDDRKSVLYETMTNVVSGSHPDDDACSCPNCGSVSTVAGLQNGCSYCGTRFQMDELFPKVTSYYFLDDVGMTKKEFKSGYLKAYLFTIAFMYILCLIIRGADFLPHNLIKSPSTLIGVLIGIPLGSLIGAYIFYAYFLFMRLIGKAISSAGKMGTAGSRRRFENRMKSISPEFSYEYFTSKAISLIKTAVFSTNEQELMFYEGGALDPKMKDIIDLNYGGALGCQSFVDEGNYVTVVTKAYFDILYATEEKIYFKPQVFSATLRRRTDIPVNFNFSMTRIACPSCGASFDAMKIKNCPYCGSKYDIITDDWTLVELKYN